jgi:hypothetical protein
MKLIIVYFPSVSILYITECVNERDLYFFTQNSHCKENLLQRNLNSGECRPRKSFFFVSWGGVG